MNRKQFLDNYRKHVEELDEGGREPFEYWIEKMQVGHTWCPFMFCHSNYSHSRAAIYYRRYHEPIRQDDIACQMVQVYCEERFE